MATERARFREIAEGRAVLVELAGALDASAEAEVADAVDRALERVVGAGGDLVLVDLADVIRLGTLGVAALLRVQEAAGEIGGIELAVITPPGCAAALELAEGGLAGLLPRYDNLDQALVHLPRNPA